MSRWIVRFLLAQTIFVLGQFQAVFAQNPDIEVIAVVKLSGVLEEVDTIKVRCDANNEAGEWIGRGETYISTSDGVGTKAAGFLEQSVHLVDSLQADLNEVVDVLIEPLGDDAIDHSLYFWSDAICVLEIVEFSEETIDSLLLSEDQLGDLNPEDAAALVGYSTANARTCNSIERGGSAATCVARGTDPKLAEFKIVRSELENSSVTSND